MAEAPTKVRVLEALKRIKSPGADADIVAEGLVSEIVFSALGAIILLLIVGLVRGRGRF